MLYDFKKSWLSLAKFPLLQTEQKYISHLILICSYLGYWTVLSTKTQYEKALQDRTISIYHIKETLFLAN